MAPRKNTTVLSMLTGSKDEEPDLPKLAGEEPEVKPDPKPGARRRASTSKKKAPASQVNAVADELETLMKVGAGAWSIRDPHCGPVLNQQARDIAVEVAELLSTNAKLMQWFDDAVGISGWIKLFKAVQPLFAAFIAHHITKKVEEDDIYGADPLTSYPAWSPGVAATA